MIGLDSGSALTRLLEAQAAQLMRAMVLRVQVRSFESVCRAVEARLGIGILPLAAAHSFAAAMTLRILPLNDPWAFRQMSLVVRAEPAPGSPLALLLDHLEACAHQPGV
jgi:DNA-binding transcriptional LysR family regulator